MSETQTKPKEKKRYESTKTLAQIWTGRGILIGILAVIGIILYQFGFTVYLLFAKPDADGPLIWASPEGIGYSEKGGEQTGVFRLPTMGGEKVQNPRYTIVGGYLVYYSPETHSLCVTNGADNPRWIPLETVMGECRVREIRPDGDVAVILLGYPTGSASDALPAPVSVARHVLGTNDAVSIEARDVIGTKAKSVERTGGSFTGIAGAPSDINSWSYDPATDLFAAGDGKTITAIRGGAKREFGLGVLYYLRGLQVVGDEVWVAAVKPFKAGHLLLSYGSDGSFKKVKLKSKSEIRPPYMKATPEIVEMLGRVSGGVSE